MQGLNLTVKDMFVAVNPIKSSSGVPPSGQGVVNLVHPPGSFARSPDQVIVGELHRMVGFLAKHMNFVPL
jgi:hypothetical protein